MSVDLISKIAEKARASSLNIGNVSSNNSDLIVSLPVNAIKYHPKNQLYFRDLDRVMKDKLMEDMRDNGQINPIIVKKNEDSTYTVLAGHQRLIAARRLNWQQIKAIVIEVSELEAEKLLIRDNLFRRHMGGMELARALEVYSKLSDNQTRKSIRQIADEIGENRNTVHFYMKLNCLIPELQQLVEDKKLTATAAQAFTSMNEEEQKKLFDTLGNSIIGMKKKELEEQIYQRYQGELSKVQNEKSQIEIERNKLLTNLESKDKDIAQYRKEAETYKQQADEYKGKAIVADISEEVKIALSKLDVINSVAASITLSTIKLYDHETLLLIQDKFNSSHAYLSTLVDQLAHIINIKSTRIPQEIVDNGCEDINLIEPTCDENPIEQQKQ